MHTCNGQREENSIKTKFRKFYDSVHTTFTEWMKNQNISMRTIYSDSTRMRQSDIKNYNSLIWNRLFNLEELFLVRKYFRIKNLDRLLSLALLDLHSHLNNIKITFNFQRKIVMLLTLTIVTQATLKFQ